MGLKAIPEQFGSGGSYLAKDGAAGSPDLKEILESHHTALLGLGAAVDDAVTPQKGTSTLVAGVSPVIAAANVTASSRIVITRKDKLTSTALGELSAPTADRVPGEPGSFRVRAYKSTDATVEAADVSSFDWVVLSD